MIKQSILICGRTVFDVPHNIIQLQSNVMNITFQINCVVDEDYTNQEPAAKSHFVFSKTGTRNIHTSTCAYIILFPEK